MITIAQAKDGSMDLDALGNLTKNYVWLYERQENHQIPHKEQWRESKELPSFIPQRWTWLLAVRMFPVS